MSRILLTNDDGYTSVAFEELAKALSEKNDLEIVVPSGQRSWIGKAITRERSVSVSKVKVAGMDANACEGTPADCVLLGLGHFAKAKPELVVAGINIGSNLAHFTAFGSGTVGAVIEAGLHGVFGVAFSAHLYDYREKKEHFYEIMDGIATPKEQRALFAPMAKVSARIISKLDARTVAKLREIGVAALNVNFPCFGADDAPWKVTSFSEFDYGHIFTKQAPDLFSHGGMSYPEESELEKNDVGAIQRGMVSITPLTLRIDSERIREVEGILK